MKQLTKHQRLALDAVVEAPTHPASLAVLAVSHGVERRSLTCLINYGFLERVDDGSAKRNILVTLTERGKQYHGATQKDSIEREL